MNIRKLLIWTAALGGAACCAAATLPFRSGDVLAAELTTAAPKIEHFESAGFTFNFERRSYALVTVRLTRGRTLGIHDYSLEIFGRKYPCVAFRIGDGGFDAARTELEAIDPQTRYGLLFVVDGSAVGVDDVEKLQLVCNADGKYRGAPIPFVNRRANGFGRAANVPADGALVLQ